MPVIIKGKHVLVRAMLLHIERASSYSETLSIG